MLWFCGPKECVAFFRLKVFIPLKPWKFILNQSSVLCGFWELLAKMFLVTCRFGINQLLRLSVLLREPDVAYAQDEWRPVVIDSSAFSHLCWKHLRQDGSGSISIFYLWLLDESLWLHLLHQLRRTRTFLAKYLRGLQSSIDRYYYITHSPFTFPQLSC